MVPGVDREAIDREIVVRAGGFEPPRFPSLEPKSSASANSATPAAAPAGAAVPTRPRPLLSQKLRPIIDERLSRRVPGCAGQRRRRRVLLRDTLRDWPR